MGTLPSAIKYSALVFQSLIFQRKTKNINFDRERKMKPEHPQSAKEDSYNCVEAASVNLLANVHECKLII